MDLENRFKLMEDEERIEALTNGCETTETISYTHKFTDEELTEKRVKLGEVQIKISDKEEEKADLVAAFKREIDPLKSDRGELTHNIKHKTEQLTEVVFLFPDHKEGIMKFVNQNGIIVFERAFLPGESQLNLHSGTNDQ